MDSNGILQKHWLHVSYHFALDVLLVVLTFVNVTGFRFHPEDFLTQLFLYWPGIVMGAIIFACAAYAMGLYSTQTLNHSLFKRSLMLIACLAIAVCVMLAVFYINFSTRIGRGVMLGSSLCAYGMVFLHHLVIWNRLVNFRERVAFVVTSEYDDSELQHLMEYGHPSIELVGLVHSEDYIPVCRVPVLGKVSDLPQIARDSQLGRVLCTSKAIHNTSLYREFCQLRYSGVTVMPLIGLFEEVHQIVPIELITPEWMMSASSSPHLLYLQKVKRGFDIACSVFFLFVFAIPLLLAMTWIKLVSKGPVFYRQVRSGRFGRDITVIKLRTMHLDAERNGAVWAAKDKDPRVIPGGDFLRKYRIDEIPQLKNVLSGDMSFVGPRPERPEFVDKLAAEIPYYRERLMVQPGITGWAQVNFPYGASVQDAVRKLEYDLYYMKHMSLFLDIFILLDTVRIIVLGGVGKTTSCLKQARSLRAVGERRDSEAEELAASESVHKVV